MDDAARQTIAALQQKGAVPAGDVATATLLQHLEKIRAPAAETMAEAAGDAAERGAREAFEEAVNHGALVSFHQLDDRTYREIKNKSFAASETTMQRLIGGVQENLAESYAQGLGIDDAADRLNGVFNNMRSYELERIARTEINSAQNVARDSEIKAMGIEYEQWWGADDERTRAFDDGAEADHTTGPPGMHGQISATGQYFSNALQFPGDRERGEQTIAEWINCRCRVVPYIMPEGYGPPPGAAWFYEADLVPLEREPAPEAVEEPEEITMTGIDDARELGTNSIKASDFMDYGKPTAGQAKDKIARDLAAELRGNAAFKKFVDAEPIIGTPKYPADPLMSKVNQLVARWAQTSGDANKQALGMQRAIAAEFKTGLKGMTHVSKSAADDGAAYYKQHSAGLRAFVRAQYNHTQKMLAEQGIDEIILYRGMKIDAATYKKMMGTTKLGEPNQVNVKLTNIQLQPASSFSSEYGTAANFAAGAWSDEVPLVMIGRVPAKKILGSARSGYGCLGESEFVVLGGKPQKWGTMSVCQRGDLIAPGSPTEFVAEAFKGHLGPAAAVKTIYAYPEPDAAVFYLLSPDHELSNADWTKQSWDLLEINNAADLKVYLTAEGMTVANFKKLPVYLLNKEKHKWLQDL